MSNNNVYYISRIREIDIDEKLNRDLKIINLGSDIKNYYIERLKENDNRIFAKYDLSDYLNPKAIAENEVWEALSFFNHFNSYFKSKTKIRFKKDIVSCFALVLRDMYENSFFSYFCVDKKEYELRNDEYLNEVFNYFKNEIDMKIKNKGDLI